jgi:uncharacterized OsmC-like protein
MSKAKESRKKSSVVKKISIGVGLVLVVVVGAAGAYWFSLPSEARNLVSFMMFGGGNYENYEEYQVIQRNEVALNPSGFDIDSTELTSDENMVNIATATEMVQNNTSSMLKKGMVQTLGIDDYTGWQLLADEGATEGNPYGPSPLSYYTTGEATNLHTQITKVAASEGVILDDVKVEVINNFHWDDMMSDEGTGHLALSTVNIAIESEASDVEIQNIKELAIEDWAAGEALLNKTEIVPNLIVNGENFEYYYARPGTATSDVSYDGEMKLSSITEEPKMPEYTELDVVEDQGLIIDMDAMSNMTFQIYAISESAGNVDRPYLKKVTISTPTEETWEVYSDESSGENDIPLAPTSLEYFSLGTSLCLTSQTTLVSAMMGMDFTDYRVEHLFEYGQEDSNTTGTVDALDTVQTYVYIESDEDQETLETFFNKSLALCFAGDGLANETTMNINLYSNGAELN